MDRESKEMLRLDRRLVRRRGHIAPEELERELMRLPDVAHKSVPLVPAEGPERRDPGQPERR